MADKPSHKPADDSATDSAAARIPPRATVLCEVFRSPRREGMYLYVERGEGLARVPEALLQRFGTPESALVFRLDDERRLARVSARDVLASLADKGFFLQMPPVPGAGTAGEEGDAPPARSSAAQDATPTRNASTHREDPSC